MTKQDKMKITNLLVRIKQIEDELERFRLFDNQIEANYNRVFDWAIVNRTVLDQQCRRMGELKAEIERLKAENKELTKVVSSKVYDLIDNAKEIADAREAWEQQAKIDVLNKLKSKCHNYYPSIDHYCCSVKAVNLSDIDELIKELIKNAEDKS